MTKRDAQARVDRGDLTWGELKTLIAADRQDRLEVSAVNPSLTHGQALDILTLAIQERDSRALVVSARDALLATNVLREVAQ